MAAPRILFSGDALGCLNQLFKRVSSVNKSAGPFDALLCVGQFFPNTPEQLEEFTDYIEGRSKIPIPTYFIGDYGVGAAKILSATAKNSANQGFKMDGLKVCENLYWLRGSGKFLLQGKLLEAKRKHLFWTPCAAHCIDLMLEDIGKIARVKRTIQRGITLVGFIYNHTLLLSTMRTFTSKSDLIRHGVTRFATSFLTLQRLLAQKNNLRKLFTSEEWSTSKLAKERKGKLATECVLLTTFWNDVVYTLKVMGPLVRVLRLVDNEKKPAMGYIYEAMDKAKEAIQNSFNGVEARYTEVFEIIDRRWECQLHHPLHAAGHYLNPQYYYSDANLDKVGEVMDGLHRGNERLSESPVVVDSIVRELAVYRRAGGMFGNSSAQRLRASLAPGLSVAYLSGRRSANSQQFGAYNQDDVDSLRALIEEPGIVDIFLTNDWPSGVTNRAAASGVPSGLSDPSNGDSTISELVAEIKPRYHIAGTVGVYYDREPYANVGSVHVTRFIALAPVGNKEKQKFIHALSPTPASKMSSAELCIKPPNTTLSPYSFVEEIGSGNVAIKRSGDTASDSQYWRYDVSQKRQKHGDGVGDRLCFKFISSGSCPRGEECPFRHDEDAREQCTRGVCFNFLMKGQCERGPDCTYKHSLEEGNGFPSRGAGSGTGSTNRVKDCWFCLSSPSLESHLITSIGEYCYCALAKGPLVQDHVLIIPIEHLSNTLSLPPECENELSRFRSSLQAYFKRQGKEVVFFEWVSKRGTHANLQAVPIPSSKASSVEQIFKLAAKKLGITFATIKNDNTLEGRKLLGMHLDKNQNLFYVELPGGTILSHVVGESEKFPIQFGREVLAGLLNMADKADWRNCQLSKEEETKMAENFKSQFKEFEPDS